MERKEDFNPYTATKQFWFKHFHMELCSGNNQLAEEHFLRYRYWMRREKVWEYLSELCKQKMKS
jgi:hypothetical protein